MTNVKHFVVETVDGKMPACYYVPAQRCGEKTICDCPSCPIRVAARAAISKEKNSG